MRGRTFERVAHGERIADGEEGSGGVPAKSSRDIEAKEKEWLEHLYVHELRALLKEAGKATGGRGGKKDLVERALSIKTKKESSLPWISLGLGADFTDDEPAPRMKDPAPLRPEGGRRRPYQEGGLLYPAEREELLLKSSSPEQLEQIYCASIARENLIRAELEESRNLHCSCEASGKQCDHEDCTCAKAGFKCSDSHYNGKSCGCAGAGVMSCGNPNGFYSHEQATKAIRNRLGCAPRRAAAAKAAATSDAAADAAAAKAADAAAAAAAFSHVAANEAAAAIEEEDKCYKDLEELFEFFVEQKRGSIDMRTKVRRLATQFGVKMKEESALQSICADATDSDAYADNAAPAPAVAPAPSDRETASSC